MNARQLIIEKNPEDGSIRVGTTEGDETGAQRQVTWTDTGERGLVRLGAGRAYSVTEGSLQHSWLVAPQSLRERLQSEPRVLFEQVLREAPRPLAPADIRQVLVALGLPTAEVGAAWKRHGAAVLASSSVDRSGKPAKYKWRSAADDEGEAASDVATARRRPTGDSESSVVSAIFVPEHALATGDGDDGLEPESRGVDDHAQGAITAEKGNDSEQPTSDGAEQRGKEGPSAAGSAGAKDLWGLLVSGALDHDGLQRLTVSIQRSSDAGKRVTLAVVRGDDPDPEDVRAVRRDPRAGSDFLGELDEATLKGLAAIAQEQPSSLLASILLGTPKKSRSVDSLDAPALMGLRETRVFLVDVIRWWDKATLRDRALAQDYLSLMTLRMCASNEKASISTKAIIRLLEVLAGSGSRDMGRRQLAQEALVDLLAGRLRGRAEGAEALDSSDLRVLSKVTQGLPFRAAGGRSSLLAALAAAGHEDVLAAGDWWIGLSADDLDVAGNGALGSVLALETIGRRRVLPLVESHLSSLATRRDLSWLLRLPAAVVDQVTPEAAAKSVWSIARSDPWLGRFLEHLRDAPGRRALVAERDQARQDLREAEDKVVRAREAVRAAEERVERLKERVADSHEQTAGLRASNERQAKIDSVRTLAQLAVTVESSAGRLSADQLLARVLAALGRQGIERLGAPGEVVSFEPAVHDQGLMAVLPGTPVVVSRSGYTWRQGEDAVVLVKAVVQAQGEGE